MTHLDLERPVLTDTHAHLCDGQFDADRREVLYRAAAAGVGAIVSVGEDLVDAESNISLAKEFPILRSAAGLCPTHLDIDAAETMIAFVRANRDDLVAVGEVGLDYWMVKNKTDRAIQREIFRRHIALSIELDLPLNVHSRSAGRHAIEILMQEGANRVQLHAFDGKIAAARAAIETGYYFSVPPSILRSRQTQKLVRHLPLERLLVETDSPVLGPDPAARNEPSNLSTSVGAIADIKGLRPGQMVEAVVANTNTVYGF